MIQFQSRNRGTCRFKLTLPQATGGTGTMFQSRNRGSCRFKR